MLCSKSSNRQRGPSGRCMTAVPARDTPAQCLGAEPVAHGIKLQDDCRAGCESDMGHVSVGHAEVACHPEDGMQELA